MLLPQDLNKVPFWIQVLFVRIIYHTTSRSYPIIQFSLIMMLLTEPCHIAFSVCYIFFIYFSVNVDIIQLVVLIANNSCYYFSTHATVV